MSSAHILLDMLPFGFQITAPSVGTLNVTATIRYQHPLSSDKMDKLKVSENGAIEFLRKENSVVT